MRCASGDVIFKEGESGDKAFIIVSGLIKIYKRDAGGEETELKKALPGEVFGEMSLLDGYPRSADAKAINDSILFYIDRKNLMQFLRENPEATLKLLETMSHRLREANEMISILSKLSKNNPLNDLAASIIREKLLEGETTEASAAAGISASPVGNGDDTGSDGDAGQEKEKQKEWVYQKSFTCPLCLKETPTMIALSKYVQVEKTEDDMCTYYRYVNPGFYSIIVCSHCGFAFPEDAPNKISPKTAERIQQQMPSIRLHRDFSGTRSADEAIAAYQLAIQCQTIAGAKGSMIGRLFLRLSCLYRQKGLPEKDTECLRQALELFEKAYSNENLNDPRGELQLLYLIGELKGRFDHLSEAIQWFSRITTHPNRHSNTYIVNKARERWQELKYQYNEQNR